MTSKFAEFNIRVNAVHPGTIRTPMTEHESVRDLVKEMEKDIPMKHIAEPKEISNLLLYLSSDESIYSTGIEFVVDGGLIQVMYKAGEKSIFGFVQKSSQTICLRAFLLQ
nr:SDR family oxidoreductase [Alkalibacterium sp. 20]